MDDQQLVVAVAPFFLWVRSQPISLWREVLTDLATVDHVLSGRLTVVVEDVLYPAYQSGYEAASRLRMQAAGAGYVLAAHVFGELTDCLAAELTEPLPLEEFLRS
jgi:hypothetical protein